jgi:Cu(I)/Ag(I) efflux system membrane fusion protein
MKNNMLAWPLAAIVLVTLGFALGRFVPHGPGLTPDPKGEFSSGKEDSGPEILYWVAPMDPDYRRDGPGKSPMGMDLVPVYAGEEKSSEGEDAIYVSPSVKHNLGVRTNEVSVRPLWRRVNATGFVGFDEDLLSRLHMRTSGWAENVRVETVGERVRRGQVLFEFYSPEILNAQKEYLQARRRGEANILAAAREKLLAFGMVSEQIDELEQRGEATRTIRVLAPQDGVVTALQAREGMYLKPESEVISLADLGSVWILAEVFEAQADWVAVGQAAEARLEYMPGEVFSGTVEYVYPVLDPMTRTLKVRLRFDNPGERLKPNMYAAVTLFGKSHQDALTIHRDALIRAQDSDRVIVDLGNGNFQAREVMTGIESGEWIQVIAGLEAGDEVVTSAQFMLDSEASLAGSFRRLEAHGSGRVDHEPINVFGSGVVEEMDPAGRWLMIRHGPIDALGWPGMTMKFDVTGSVDMGRIRSGQNVHFSIEPDDQGVYRIDMVHLVDSDEQKIGETPAEHDHD